MKDYSNSKVSSLFEILEKRGISQKQLSEGTQISTGNISDWKTGKSSPKPEALCKISDFLNCSVDYLLGLTDNPVLHSTALSAEEKRVIELFSRLDDIDKGVIIGRMEAVLESEKYKQDGLSGEKAM